MQSIGTIDRPGQNDQLLRSSGASDVIFLSRFGRQHNKRLIEEGIAPYARSL